MQSFYEFPTSLELSSDLEWMLQSGQVEDAILAATLIREYYGQLFGLFKSVFDKEEAIESCIYQTFAVAVARRHTYRAEIGVSAWLFSHALGVYRKTNQLSGLKRWGQKLPGLFKKPEASKVPTPTSQETSWLDVFQHLGEESRLLLWLHLAHDFSTTDLAKIYKKPEELIQGTLTTDLTYLFFLARQTFKTGNQVQIDDFKKYLKETLRVSQNEHILAEEKVYNLVAEISSHTTPSQRRVTSLTLKEFALGGVVLVVAGAMWFFSNLADKSLATSQQAPKATATHVRQQTQTPISPPTLAPSATPTHDATPTQPVFSEGTNAFIDFSQLAQPRLINSDPLSRSGPAAVSLALQAWGWDGSWYGGGDGGGDPDRPIQVMQPNEKDHTVLPYEMMEFVEKYTQFNMLMRLDGNPGLICNLVTAGYPVIVQRAIVTDTMGTFQKSALYDAKISLAHFEAEKLETTTEITTTKTISASQDVQAAEWEAGYEVLTECDSDRFDFYSWRPSKEGMSYYLLSVWEFLQGWWAFDNAYYIIYPAEEETKIMWILAGQGNAYERDQSDADANFINAIETTSERIYSASTSLQSFYAWFNRGTALTYVDDYTWAAEAFDTAFEIYAEIPAESRPRRMIWYNTRPYWAYYYTGRYQDVIDLATSILEGPGGDVLEESYYWRGLAYEALEDIPNALADQKMAVELNRMFQPGLEALLRLKADQ